MENTIRLNNGAQMPMIGYGVYQIPSIETERCVTDALSIGYRSIDTSKQYENMFIPKGIIKANIPPAKNDTAAILHVLPRFYFIVTCSSPSGEPK